MKHRLGGFASGLVGVLVGALIVGSMPALAGDGDLMVVGQKNVGKTVTRLNTRGGLRVDNIKAGKPALILNVVDPLSAPMQVSGSGMVDNLNADAVDGWDANQLLRATFASTSDAGDANGTALSTTITAPADGWLLITGGLDALGTTTDYFSCEIQVDANPVSGSIRSILVEDQADAHTGNSEEDCSTTGAILVNAGVHTVSLVISSRETAQFFGGSIWALFVPFDGTGMVPTPLDG